MKKVLILIILIGAVALLFVAGKTVSKETAPSWKSGATVVSALTATPTHYDFGTISMKDGKVSRMFTIANESEQSIIIRKVTTSCMCTEAFVVQNETRKGPFGMPGHGSVPLVNAPILPKETLGIEVVYDPAAHGPAGVGEIERAVFIEDENGGMQTITIKAFVTP